MLVGLEAFAGSLVPTAAGRVSSFRCPSTQRQKRTDTFEHAQVSPPLLQSLLRFRPLAATGKCLVGLQANAARALVLAGANVLGDNLRELFGLQELEKQELPLQVGLENRRGVQRGQVCILVRSRGDKRGVVSW